MGEATHADVHFQGRVQGVGFRYAVNEVAREYEVAGYVQNLLDGRVRVEAEGDQAELDRFVSAIEDRMQGYIRKVEKSFRVRTRQFSGFRIQ
ncbi:MAG TPA: acylphosphatase [Opitutaceae bacterium]|jgi:acylphosphatase